ncbi:MAG: acetoacetyl-CoA reductase [Alphaproteobacteria bacterium]|nr:acetoacetyl-CoA reductase [Alphaproteobacteria bacterium]
MNTQAKAKEIFQQPVTTSVIRDGAPQGETAPRVVLVTGGTGAIGTEICKKLARLGHIVATTYRNEDKAKAWQEALKKEGYTFHLYKCDVSDFDACQNAVKNVIQDLGPIQIIVNNAGITRDATLRKMSHEQWRDVLTSNLDSVFNVTRAALNGMLDTGFGRVINISSINGQKGQFGQSNYAAAKAGMHGFTKALAQEVASKGITVNTVSPGYVETDMIMAVPEKVRASIKSQIPVGRFGTPEDVAHVVAFLIDDASGFITGANIAANGGHFMD